MVRSYVGLLSIGLAVAVATAPGCNCGRDDDETSCPAGTYLAGSDCLPCSEPAHCGAECLDCSALARNHACVEGACGCLSVDDCAPGELCSDDRCVACVPDCTNRCGGADDGCGGECTYCPAGLWCIGTTCSLSSDVALYVVPAIRDVRILPGSGPPATAESYVIAMTAALGEHEPASFVVRPQLDLSGLAVEATTLISTAGDVIAAEDVDLRVVKVWWQAGVEIWDNEPATKTLAPELLLKDDGLITVEGEDNYVRLGTERRQLSAWDLTDTGTIIDTIDDFPVQDAATLQPFDVPAGTNKQLWVTVRVPADAAPGAYSGRLLVRRATGEVGSVGLELRVLPFALAPSPLTYSLYYRGEMSGDWPDGSVSSEWKSEAQLRAELRNMFEHGVTNPTVYQGMDDTLLPIFLEARREAGTDGQPLFFLGMGTGSSSDPTELAELTQRVEDLIAFVTPYGVTDVYIYGHDEATGAELEAQRLAWEAVHAGGGKVFVAGYLGAGGNFDVMGDIQDLLICATGPSAEEAARWHGEGHLIFNYANPQVGNEQPERYRRNYGLLLWQADYDGAMDYAYQHSFGSLWNDFDHVDYRDHVFAYATVDGVIDTVEWEGFREGVDDIRYLATLQQLVAEKKAEGRDTSVTEAWLADLKSGSLTDLDAIRAGLVEHLLYLRGEGPLCGTGAIEQGEECDGTSFGASSCESLGFEGGELGCRATCTIDTCACTPPLLSVAFTDPTPADGELVSGSEARVATSLESSCYLLSGYLDLDASLLGYWSFNEGSGTTAGDASSHGGSCTVTGASWVAGQFGSALRFDGVDDEVSCGELGIGENAAATLEGWFNFAELAMERGAHLMLFPRLYQHSANDHFYVAWTNDYFPVAGLVGKNEWFHVALTSAGDSSTARLYLNGEPVEIVTQGTPEAIVAIASFSVGTGSGTTFSGLVDEVRAWNRVLSWEELQSSHDASRHRLAATFRELAAGSHQVVASITNALGQSAQTETRTFTTPAE